MRCVGVTVAVLAAVCFVVRSGGQGAGPRHDTAPAPGLQQLYEWQKREAVYAYSQDSSVTLLAFTVPRRTTTAEFHVNVYEVDDDQLNRTVVLSLRRSAIPVVNAYNETVPEHFLLPADQQTAYAGSRGTYTLTLASPTPGRVYLTASVLNPLPDVVDFLRWGQPMPGSCGMDVKAIYTFRTTLTSLPTDRVSKINVTAGQPQTFSFTVPAFTTAYSVMVSNCQGNGSDCTVTMTASESLAAQDSSSSSVDCRQQGPRCLLAMASPLTESEHFVTFSLDAGHGSQDIVFDVTFEIQGCSVTANSYSDRNGQTEGMSPAAYTNVTGYGSSAVYTNVTDYGSSAVYTNVTDYGHGASNHSPPACVNLGRLGRASVPADSFAFEAQFGTWTVEGDFVPAVYVVVPDFNVEVRTFTLQDSVDSGGILSIKAALMDTDWKGRVWVCAMAQRVAQNGSVQLCPTGALLTLNVTNGTQGHHLATSLAYLPFPAAGPWYLAMQSECWGKSGAQPCEMLPMVMLSVHLTQCAPNQCGQYGTCQMYMEATTVFAGCQCLYGYRGLACSDDTHGLTKGEQLTAVYLLTLSNLAFLPGIVLALYRRHFTLAAIFSFNCFFSTFYHACDANHVYQLCIMDYGTLAFCDFFGSVLSFYAVLIFNAKIPKEFRTFLLLSGAMVIAVFQDQDRHNDLEHVLPLVTAGVIMVVSWVWEMRASRQLFPSRRRYLCCLLPGVVLALTGIGVNYGLMWHKSSYQYTHSFWHVALMVSTCLLMPPRADRLSASQKALSVSAQDIKVGRPEQNQRQPSRRQDEDDDDEPAMLDASTNGISSDRSLLI